MTDLQLALTPGIASRLVTFVVTLAVGIGLSQLLPMRLWEARNSNVEAPATKQMNRGCRK